VRPLVFVVLAGCSFFSGVGHADRTGPFADRADCTYTRRSLIVDLAAVGVSAVIAATIDRRRDVGFGPVPVPLSTSDAAVGGVYLLSAGYGLYATYACERAGDAIWPPPRNHRHVDPRRPSPRVFVPREKSQRDPRRGASSRPASRSRGGVPRRATRVLSL